MGDIQTWDSAELQLKKALNKFKDAGNGEWELNEGDGAFYGPKIDIEISDALKRDFQCATIQLDFQIPQNFQLEYMTAEASNKPKDSESLEKQKPNGETEPSIKSKQLGPGRARPVMLHRAIIGSFERFMAIITEHFGGKWPFWLSPRQILVIPVTPVVNDYAEEVQQLFWDHNMYVDVDTSGNTMPKKIRTGQLQQYNFIFGKSGPGFPKYPLLMNSSCWCPGARVKVCEHSKSRRSRDASKGRIDSARRSNRKTGSSKEGKTAYQLYLVPNLEGQHL